jgi:hypothetical protein
VEKELMEYLNRDVLESLSAARFQKTQPYPYAHIDHSLTAEAYARLK